MRSITDTKDDGEESARRFDPTPPGRQMVIRLESCTTSDLAVEPPSNELLFLPKYETLSVS